MQTRGLKRAIWRSLAWFLPSETPMGLWMPAKLSSRVIIALVTLPATAWLTAHVHQPFWCVMHGMLLGVWAVDDWCEWLRFQMGMKTGRRELVLEAWQARDKHDIDPREYLSREWYVGGLEADRLMREWKDERDGYG